MADLVNRINNDFAYHQPKNPVVADLHQNVRTICRSAAFALVNNCPEGRELSLALTKLEEAMMWANAAIARNQ